MKYLSIGNNAKTVKSDNGWSALVAAATVSDHEARGRFMFWCDEIDRTTPQCDLIVECNAHLIRVSLEYVK